MRVFKPKIGFCIFDKNLPNLHQWPGLRSSDYALAQKKNVSVNVSSNSSSVAIVKHGLACP